VLDSFIALRYGDAVCVAATLGNLAPGLGMLDLGSTPMAFPASSPDTTQPLDNASRFAWGFVPRWAARKGTPAIINAREESVMKKPTFREAFLHQRCLVLADSFFEWRSTGRMKVSYRIALKNSEPALAGVWHPGPAGSSNFAIITTTPNTLVAPIHDRMPVILPVTEERRRLKDWLSVSLLAMLRPYDSSSMDAYPVSTLVNAPTNDTEAVLTEAA
jgi:putative SOS response-associated peptidase YedK